MNELDGLLDAVVEGPMSEDRWSVVADWLEEHDADPRRAELLRLHRRLIVTCCEPDNYPERTVWQARVVELLGQGVRPCVPRRTVTLAEGVEMTFSFIPPGGFLAGIPLDEAKEGEYEKRERRTTMAGFYLGTTLVTQAQWRAVMGDNPSKFEGDDLPVEQVPKKDCLRFCKLLGRKARRRFRLPTDVEWEYAARAGTTTPFFTGESITPDQANFDRNHDQTTPAGTFPPNAWGLFDTHGNLWEWCSDGKVDRRVTGTLCGGCWCLNAEDCRFTQRCGTTGTHWTYGFRVLMSLS